MDSCEVSIASPESDMWFLEMRQEVCPKALGAKQMHHCRRCRLQFAAKEMGMRRGIGRHPSTFVEGRDIPARLVSWPISLVLGPPNRRT